MGDLNILKLAPEIRVRLYGFLFDAGEPIDITVGPNGYLMQPDEKSSTEQTRLMQNTLSSAPGRSDFTAKAHQLSSQLLQTCRQLFEEATVYLYTVNTFSINDRETWKFNNLLINAGTRLCIKKLQINLLSPGKQPDYGTISALFPAVNTLSVKADGPGPTLLLAAYELSKVLVCSDIFPDEPRLQIRARVPCTQETMEANTTARASEAFYRISKKSDEMQKFQQAFKSPVGFRLSNLDVYTTPFLRLGKQITDFGVISVCGDLHQEFLPAIKKHECSFGDCHFEMIHEGKVDSDGFKEKVFVWKRKGTEAAAIRGKDLADTASLMRNFVPSLSPDFIMAMGKAGLNTELLQKDKPSDLSRRAKT